MPIVLSDLAYRDEDVMPVIPPGHTESIANVTFAGPGTEQVIWWEKIRWAINKHRRPVSQDEQLAHSVRDIVERIVDWTGFEDRDENGELVPLPFSKARATEILSDPRFGWLFGQCLVFVNSAEAFAPKRQVE